MPEISEGQIFKEFCENDFSFFVQQYLKVVEPETTFEWTWHLDALCHYCERVYYGDYQNIDINIPPRMLKSVIISVMFPCWVWTKAPSKKFICASRSYDLSNEFNMKRRDLILSDAYQALWKPVIREDMNTATKFGNIYGGFMQAASALGKLTGAGGDFLISDDLLDALDAFSSTKRQAVNNWYSNVFYNRAQNKKTVKRININQRLHVNDPSGNIEERHNFHKLVLPMVKTSVNLSTVDFVDPRQEGDFLHPSRYSDAEKNDDYKALGVYGWSAQYQQSPKPVGGGIIKEEWLRYYSSANSGLKFDKTIITADLTFKGDSDSDYVCFQYWGSIGLNKYLIDIVRGKWSYKITKEKFIAFCQKNNAAYKYIEGKANGPALISDLGEKIKGLHSWPAKGSKYMNADKIQRLHLCSEQYENGCVYIPNDIELAEQFKDELISFTEKGSTTGHDDMVDTSTMALLELRKVKIFAEG